MIYEMQNKQIIDVFSIDVRRGIDIVLSASADAVTDTLVQNIH